MGKFERGGAAPAACASGHKSFEAQAPAGFDQGVGHLLAAVQGGQQQVLAVQLAALALPEEAVFDGAHHSARLHWKPAPAEGSAGAGGACLMVSWGLWREWRGHGHSSVVGIAVSDAGVASACSRRIALARSAVCAGWLMPITASARRARMSLMSSNASDCWAGGPSSVRRPRARLANRELTARNLAAGQRAVRRRSGWRTREVS